MDEMGKKDRAEFIIYHAQDRCFALIYIPSTGQVFEPPKTMLLDITKKIIDIWKNRNIIPPRCPDRWIFNHIQNSAENK